ncbi:sensor histidine kinase [Actinomadura parmotrematis]|uniref:histidine kinase n=1 Tax=Actinomadura parmotrematis TaxID=2864039 RepID=A0ABS7FRK4_9ACTN|nr:sensor domain-containing protein [Actinomadura parmotrematis]MBW8483034.1 sensor domain-containing protein [Actinomadura parmotrematis]
MNIRASLQAPGRGFRLWLLSVPALFAATALLVSLGLAGAGIGIVLVPAAVVAVRRLADTARRLTGEWTGHRVERPYLPEPAGPESAWGRFLRLVSDPATWRDLAWLLADPFVAMFTALLPALLLLYGAWGWFLALGGGRLLVGYGMNDWYAFVHVHEGYGDDLGVVALTAALGTAFLGLGLRYGPRLLDVYGSWAELILGPTEAARLALRVEHLTETRSDALDVSAAELRRIERDLHDGAQARLVAMGMSLGAIEHLLDTDPARARTLLAQTRESSARALHELRDLVRGIHPPVLADRGLGDAVRALALDHPLRVEVNVDLPERPDPPVESAAYFAVAELLTNAAKHSGADRVWVDLRREGGALRISVTDDGAGGATLAGGTGLRGIERRIGTFDGVLALTSPPGGPTTVTLELPCASSSPKT